MIHQSSHVYVGDEYGLGFFCVEYQGVRYGFGMNLTPVATDPSGLYWKMDIPTFGKSQSDAKGCIPVGTDLKVNIPSAYFQGKMYQFTLNNTPVPSDPFGFYWKMDLGTFKSE